LYGEAAAIDRAAMAAVDRERRLIAELNRVGDVFPTPAAQPSLVQEHVPCTCADTLQSLFKKAR
jgi:hypothetical protein